ncbi:hypothetical protein BGX38DRAFT_1296966 [Terfezia claveryi]|nr:hypothetical protein BGX38DRAFT_1296966 [Terfezia claveryi]
MQATVANYDTDDEESIETESIANDTNECSEEDPPATSAALLFAQRIYRSQKKREWAVRSFLGSRPLVASRLRSNSVPTSYALAHLEPRKARKPTLRSEWEGRTTTRKLTFRFSGGPPQQSHEPTSEAGMGGNTPSRASARCCLPTHPKRLADFIGSPCETLRAMGVTEIQLPKEFRSEIPFSIMTIFRHTLVAGKETKNSQAAVTISVLNSLQWWEQKVAIPYATQYQSQKHPDNTSSYPLFPPPPPPPTYTSTQTIPPTPAQKPMTNSVSTNTDHPVPTYAEAATGQKQSVKPQKGKGKGKESAAASSPPAPHNSQESDATPEPISQPQKQSDNTGTNTSSSLACCPNQVETRSDAQIDRG